MDELGKIVRPQSPTRPCKISPDDKSHIGLILSETNVTDKSGEKILSVRSNEIVCALSSKTIYLSNTGQIISNIDLPYYWCNFCTFTSEDKHHLLNHLMDHRFRCQYCVFQTFSRIDVVRHMVEEHKQFEGEDLKFCVLLPDLLKHRLKVEDARKSISTKPSDVCATEETPSSESSQKRKRVESSSEDESKKSKSQKGTGAIPIRGRGKRRGRAGEPVKKDLGTNSEEEVPVVRRSTRSTPADDGTKTSTPGVCFECSLCKFRTFQKPLLQTHTKAKHDKTKPSFSLKIVSRTEAKEIEESDGKNKSGKKNDKDKEKRDKDKEKREKDPEKSDKDKGKGEKDQEKSDKDKGKGEKDPEKNDKYKGKGEKDPEKTDKNRKDSEKDKEETEKDAPVVEMDYAEEDDDDDYVLSEIDDDDDEDFVPSSEKKKPSKRKSPIHVPSSSIVKVKSEFKPAEPKMFKCLLCTNVLEETFTNVKKHYVEMHPGGSLIMSESVGSEEQWIYFCITDRCPFKNINPISWLEHSKICQKTAFEQSMNDRSSIHYSVINTANTVKENMIFIRKAQNAATIVNPPINSDAANIKQEPVEIVPTKYIYSAEPVPICLTANTAVAQTDSIPPASPDQPMSVVPSSTPPPVVQSYLPPSDPVPVPVSVPVPAAPLPNISSPNPLAGRSNAAIVNMMMIERMKNKISPVTAISKPTASATSTTPSNSTTALKPSSTTAQIPSSAATPSSSSTVAPKLSNTAAPKLSNTTAPKLSNTTAPKLSNTTAPIPSSTATPNPSNNAATPLAKQTSTAVVRPTTSVGGSSKGATQAQSSSKGKKSPEENVPFDIDIKGNYKCAHCRFLGSKALEIRTHMVERHRMNPLYGLDMLAEEKNVPRFMMFCPKDNCKFCTKGKDLFLQHLDECASVETDGVKFTDEYKKRVEVTKNFAAKTLQKLQSLTQQ